ncbi:nucleoside deaminase [Lentibacillus amyloliquefaciens]|uniref:Guanine deaminase n=1 Tax=Lentibacillus amyloliquefaciens TaxID=1472767 RepID=A0A0U4F134_9BACI|nr:nucleoside deaminase [Lentibacillus amyloliquefaciens]ALX49223.1 guanine deaminase [Lentibacillus amyloliquefaciens]
MDQFMERAVELAAENVRNGGEPFGAVLVKNGKQVAEGVNELHKSFDVTAHAEIQAMRKVQKMMHSQVLQGYTMYASGEPCPMCLTAMYFAGIDTIYYCNSSEDAVESGLGKAKDIYEELQKPKRERQMEMVHMPLKDGQENPMQLWKERS